MGDAEGVLLPGPTRPPAESSPRVAGWVRTLGLALSPVAVLLIVLEVVGAIAGAHRYLGGTDLSSKRATLYWIYFIVVGSIGPIALALIWFDPMKTGMTSRSRFALIGFIGTSIGVLAALLLVPY